MPVGSARIFTTSVFSVIVTEITVIMIMIMMASEQAMVLQVTPHLYVSAAASLLCRQGLEGSAGQAVMPGHLAAHAELVAAAVAGSAHIRTPGRYPTFERCQDLQQCNMCSCTAGWYD